MNKEQRHTSSFIDPGKLVDEDLELVFIDWCTTSRSLDYVPYYRFEMRHVPNGALAGRLSARMGNTEYIVRYAGHIGYAVDPRFRGQRYAARASRLVLSLFKQHAIEPVWVTCNPENIASRRTCEILGGRLVEIVELPKNIDMYREGDRYKCRYCIDI